MERTFPRHSPNPIRSPEPLSQIPLRLTWSRKPRHQAESDGRFPYSSFSWYTSFTKVHHQIIFQTNNKTKIDREREKNKLIVLKTKSFWRRVSLPTILNYSHARLVFPVDMWNVNFQAIIKTLFQVHIEEKIVFFSKYKNANEYLVAVREKLASLTSNCDRFST